METNLPESGKHPDRWTLIRDLVVLQAKLIVDGFRDLLLVPASLVAGIWSLVSGDRDRPGPQFYQLISLGKQSELWIDLFKAYEHAPEDVRREHEIAEEYERGGVTAQAKERIDKALDAIQRSRTP
jgi:hypothetical protein